MTDLKFNILKILYESNSRRELNRYEIMHSVSDDPNLIKKALEELESTRFIKNLTCSEVFKLTPEGAIIFEQIKEEREKEAKKESQQRFDNKISVVSLLIPLVTFIIGLIVEHYSHPVSLILLLFS